MVVKGIGLSYLRNSESQCFFNVNQVELIKTKISIVQMVILNITNKIIIIIIIAKAIALIIIIAHYPPTVFLSQSPTRDTFIL